MTRLSVALIGIWTMYYWKRENSFIIL